jgi:hypothetical protein
MSLRRVWFVIRQDGWKSELKNKRVKIYVLKSGYIEMDRQTSKQGALPVFFSRKSNNKHVYYS